MFVTAGGQTDATSRSRVYTNIIRLHDSINDIYFTVQSANSANKKKIVFPTSLR